LGVETSRRSDVAGRGAAVEALATLKGDAGKRPVTVERKAHQIAAFQARHRAHGLSVSPILDVYEPGSKIALTNGAELVFFLADGARRLKMRVRSLQPSIAYESS